MKEYINPVGNVMAAFFRDLLKNWYIIAISLVIFLGVSMVYLKLSAKTYKVGASVLLNMDQKQNGGSRSDDVLPSYNDCGKREKPTE